MPEFIDDPFHFDGRGRTAATDGNDHVRDMIFQVLFTYPGERVNRPDFGSGLRQLVFMPGSDALATATQFLVLGALQRWLAGVIKVHRVEVTNQDGQLVVDVSYTRLADGQRTEDRFAAPTN